MKKIIALIAVVVIYLASAYAIGHYAHTTMENQAAQISSTPGYQAEISDFKHGLLSSSMKLNIDLDTDYLFSDLPQQDIPELQDFLDTLEEEGVVYDINVFHGPLVFHKGIYAGLLKAELRLTDEQEWVQAIRSALDTETLIDNTLAINYFGKGSGYLHIAPTDFEDDELELNFGGMNIEFELQGYNQHYSTSGSIQPMTISADDGILSLSALNFSGDGELSSTQVNPGRFELELDSVSFNDGVQTLFSMSGLSGTFEAKLDDNDRTFSMDYQLAIDSIESPQLNPGINAINLDLGLVNLDQEGFNTFYKTAMEASEMEDEFQAQMAMMQATSKLMTGTPRLEIRKLHYQQGADITLDVAGHFGLAQDISANAGNPFALMAALDAELNMNFTEQFYTQMVELYVDRQVPTEGINQQFRTQMREQQINQYNGMLQQMLGNGYLQQENDQYNLKATMSNGEININDMPLAIPFF